MRHTDKVVLEDGETGSPILYELGYVLPMYNIGERVKYTINDEPESDEVTIVGMDISVNLDRKKKQYVTEVIYRPSDNSLVEEDEITAMYDDQEEEANDDV